MTAEIASPDLQGQIDGTLMRTLYKPLQTALGADVVVLAVSYLHSGLQFRAPKLDGRPWVMVDFCEYFCQAGDTTHLFGVSDEAPIDAYGTEDWTRFSDWVADNPPALYFKRELFEQDRTDTVLPVEYPVSIPIPEPVSRAEFEARPCEVFNCWGLSNHERSRFHGEIFTLAGEFGLTVADSWAMFDHFAQHPEGRLWATIHTHCTQRIPIDRLINHYQARSRVSCSFPGSGVKCFRHGEACVGSIMAMPRDGMAWSYPWNGGQNCFRFTNPEELASAVQSETSYEIYLECQKNAARYASEQYVADYMVPNIERALG